MKLQLNYHFRDMIFL